MIDLGRNKIRQFAQTGEKIGKTFMREASKNPPRPKLKDIEKDRKLLLFEFLFFEIIRIK